MAAASLWTGRWRWISLRDMTEYLPDEHYKGIEHEEVDWDVKAFLSMLIFFTIVGAIILPFLR